MLRWSLLFVSSILVFGLQAGDCVAQSSLITVRFSPTALLSSDYFVEFPYVFRSDSIEDDPKLKADVLKKEKKQYGSLIKAGKCKRIRDSHVQQDCVGLVTEWLFWGGSLEDKNPAAELRGFGANNFLEQFLCKYGDELDGGEKVSRKNDIIACIYKSPLYETPVCKHVALVLGEGRIVTKDEDGSVFEITGGEASLKVAFPEYDFVYYRLKKNLRAEMMYDLFDIEKKTGKVKTNIGSLGWSPRNLKLVDIRIFPKPEYIKSPKPVVLPMTAKKTNVGYIMQDRAFLKTLQDVYDTHIKMLNIEPSRKDLKFEWFALKFIGNLPAWDLSVIHAASYSRKVNGETKRLAYQKPAKGLAKAAQMDSKKVRRILKNE